MGALGLGWTKRSWDGWDWVELEGVRCVWLGWAGLGLVGVGRG